MGKYLSLPELRAIKVAHAILYREPYVIGEAVEAGLFEPSESKEEIFEAIRREFVMNFLRGLVFFNVETLKRQLDSSTSSISKPPVTSWFDQLFEKTSKHFENTLFDSIADVLIKHKLEDDKVEAARLVAAAFLSNNLFPPIPEGFLPADSTQPHDPDELEPGPAPPFRVPPPPLPPRENVAWK